MLDDLLQHSENITGHFVERFDEILQNLQSLVKYDGTPPNFAKNSENVPKNYDIWNDIEIIL